jgi:hypothetical protein
MLKEGLKKQLDILSPAREYPRETLKHDEVEVQTHRPSAPLPTLRLLYRYFPLLKHFALSSRLIHVVPKNIYADSG